MDSCAALMPHTTSSTCLLLRCTALQAAREPALRSGGCQHRLPLPGHLPFTREGPGCIAAVRSEYGAVPAANGSRMPLLAGAAPCQPGPGVQAGSTPAARHSALVSWLPISYPCCHLPGCLAACLSCLQEWREKQGYVGLLEQPHPKVRQPHANSKVVGSCCGPTSRASLMWLACTALDRAPRLQPV